VSVAGLILAAGESRRMGSPKALLEFQGETFLDRLIGLFSRHCMPVIAVLGAERDRIAAALRRTPEANIIENPDFRAGQLSSMQCGLQAVPADAEGVLFTLADRPAIEPQTITALLESEQTAVLRIPRYGGRRGHPIFFSSSLIAEFLALPPGATARDVVARHANGIAYIDVADPGILENVDDPEGYRRLVAGSRA
jgi:molybdenum cofactor cytidylyltransferase